MQSSTFDTKNRLLADTLGGLKVSFQNECSTRNRLLESLSSGRSSWQSRATPSHFSTAVNRCSLVNTFLLASPELRSEKQQVLHAETTRTSTPKSDVGVVLKNEDLRKSLRKKSRTQRPSSLEVVKKKRKTGPKVLGEKSKKKPGKVPPSAPCSGRALCYDECDFEVDWQRDVIATTDNESIVTCSTPYRIDLSASKEAGKLKLSLLNALAGSLLSSPNFRLPDDVTRCQIISTANLVTALDAEFILKACLYSRRELNIRTTSNFLLALAASLQECRPFLKKYFSQCIMLPSDWIEVAEIYQSLGDKCLNFGSLPAVLRKAMIAKFPDFDEYQLAKYNKEKSKGKPLTIMRPVSYNAGETDDEAEELVELKALTLKQLIRKLHISRPAAHVMGLLGKKYPDSSEGFYKSQLPGSWDSALSGKRMKLATPETWETQVSSKGNKASTWEQLIDNKKLPFMAMLRNLRNMIKAGIDGKHHSWVQRKLSDERAVINSKQFPFRFFSAYAVLDELQKDLDGADDIVPQEQQPRFKSKGKGYKGKKKQAQTSTSIKYDGALLAKYRKSLDAALKSATSHNVKPLPGYSYVICDVSEMLNVPCTSARGLGKPRTVLEMALLMGFMCKYCCEGCQLVLYHNGNIEIVKSLDNDTILNNMATLLDSSVKHLQDGTTAGESCNEWIVELLTSRKSINNVILLGSGNSPATVEMVNVVRNLIKIYKLRSGSDVLAVSIDLAGRSDCSNTDETFVHVSGYSDQILRFIAERGSSGQVEHVDRIDKIYDLPSIGDVISKQQKRESIACSRAADLYQLPTWRTVKVFISSTFRDMHGERDFLTRYLIPKIQKHASLMNVNVYEIDLRWGITEQEAKSDRQLEICLSEVAKADIFIGMLGSRYGYIPEDYKFQNDGQFAWLEDYPSGRSITELEIHSFALQNPKEAEFKAFFYFRDDAFLGNVPAKLQKDFTGEDHSSQLKLAALKCRIVEAGLKVCQNYAAEWGGVHDGKPMVSGLQQFGNAVLKDMTTALQKHCSAEEISKPAHDGARDKALAEQEMVPFVGRKAVLRSIKTFVSSKPGGIVMLCGKQGSGKSAVMSQLYKEFKGENGNAFSYFVSLSRNNNQPVAILKSLVVELANHYQLDVPVPENYGELCDTFTELLQSALDIVQGQKLVVLVDGLDLIESLQLQWLPSPLPKGVVLIVSCIENGPAFRIINGAHSPEVIKLGSLDIFEKAQLVRNVLLQYRKRLDESPFNNQMKLLLAKRDSISPMYLRLVCEDLRIYSVFEQLTRHLKELAPTTVQFLANLLDRLENDYGKQLVANMLITLAASRDGLSECQLFDIVSCMMLHCNLGEFSSIDEAIATFAKGASHTARAQFTHLLLACRGIMKHTETSEKDNIQLNFGEVKAIIVRRYSCIDNTDLMLFAHTVLAAYYWNIADPDGMGSWTGKSATALSELPYHLKMAQMFGQLDKVLCSLSFIRSKFEMGCGHQLAEDYLFQDVKKKVDAKRAKTNDTMLEEFHQFVLRNSHICSRYPQLVVQQALNDGNLEVKVQGKAMQQDSSFVIEQLSCSIPSTTPCKTIILTDEILCVASCAIAQVFAVGLTTGSVKTFCQKSFKETGTFRAHSTAVSALCYLDSNRLCTCSVDGIVNIWNTRDVYRSHSIKAHRRCITQAVATSDGRHVITAGLDSIARVHNTVSGDDVGRFNLNKPSSYVAVSVDDKFAAVACWDGQISIWNILENKRHGVLKGHQVSVQCCCFSPNGIHLASADLVGSIFIWSFLAGIKVGIIGNACSSLTSLTFVHSGRALLAAGKDATLKVWSGNLGTHEKSHEPQQQGDRALSLAVHPNGRVAISYHSGTIRIHNAATDTWRSVSDHSCAVQSICWLEKGDRLVSGSDDKTVKIYENGKYLVTFAGHGKSVKCVAASSCYVASCSDDFTVMLWPILFLPEAGTIAKPDAILRGHDGPVSCCAFSSTGSKLVTASYDQAMIVWDVGTYAMVHKIDNCHKDWVTACAWSDVGDFVVTGSRDFTLKLWDTRNGTEKRKFIGHKSAINSISYKFGCIASASYDGSVKLWTEKGIEVSTIAAHKERVNSCALTNRKPRTPPEQWSDVIDESDLSRNELARSTKPLHDDIVLFTASDDGLVKSWSPFTSQLYAEFSGHSEAITGVAVLGSMDSMVASTSTDKSIRIWNTTEDVLHCDADNILSCVMDVCLNSLGTLYAVGTKDGHVRIIAVYDDKLYAAYKVSTSAVTSVCFTPSDCELVVGCDDGEFTLCAVDGTRSKSLFQLEGGFRVASSRGVVVARTLVTTTAIYFKDLKRNLSPRITLSRFNENHPVEFVCICSHNNKIVLLCLDNETVVCRWNSAANRHEETISLVIDDGEDEDDRGFITAVCHWDGAVKGAKGGDAVLCGYSDGVIRAFDAGKGDCKETIHAHNARVTALRGIGGLLISASADKTVKIHDVNAKLVGIFFCESTVTSLACHSAAGVLTIIAGESSGATQRLIYNRRRRRRRNSTTAI